MRILLVGEFSRLHNSLKEGLIQLGHEVVLINNGDGFKNFPTDYTNRAMLSESKIGNIFRQAIYRIIKLDISTVERGIRFLFHLSKLQNFDIIQLINEAPIQTTQKLEFYLLKKLVTKNKKTFLLCSGVDFMTLQHMLLKNDRYSIMNPYFDVSVKNKKQYDFMFDYNSKIHKKIHTFLYYNISGVIATDLDYVNPIKNNAKYVGMIPNPINMDKIDFKKINLENKIVLFLGINSGNSIKKGISYFEKALQIVQEKYKDKVHVQITKNIPYQEYIKIYDDCHILLDQVYGFDQGYNALEAMAKGKVVFTGAETEFLKYYNLQEDQVAINALPDVNYLVEKLSFLIENPDKLKEIGKNARNFIEKEHDYKIIAKKYLETWNK